MQNQYCGMMSGTSLDGVSVAVIETDGLYKRKFIEYKHKAYTQVEQSFFKSVIQEAYSSLKEGVDRGRLLRKPSLAQIQDHLGSSLYEKILKIQHILTERHIEGFRLLESTKAHPIEAIGVHGQTIAHFPAIGWTWQILDASLMANTLGQRIVYDFRSADIEAGGQGAPLLPIYHQVAVQSCPFERNRYPVAVLNIGGVSNLTYIPHDGDLVAFDVAFGNGPSDDIVQKYFNQPYDKDGNLALSGKPNGRVCQSVLAHEFFNQRAPKSLDRFQWVAILSKAGLDALSPADACATLSLILAKAVMQSLTLMPSVKTLIVCGGGRFNQAFMRDFEAELSQVKVLPSDAIQGLNGDSIEAEGFAYFAARFFDEKPITFSSTTKVRRPVVCGVLVQPT